MTLGTHLMHNQVNHIIKTSCLRANITNYRISINLEPTSFSYLYDRLEYPLGDNA